ncbi:hypothetical protein GQE96_26220 [Escherichia coli]|uniref:Uncharacterized protein n=1 Tax=Enterobacter roggenkampii TaxID=1812935 RepID=A0AAU9BIS8_9ENTR|nr:MULTISPECIES: hypothetical protein [Enterobacteriaceae]HDU5251313.1 hypothetical protein [Klebsiella pneumoniae subsp. pneumoniae]MCK6864903.1 hypothetical protein [Enterobacter kobei]MWG03669.1 hypothetical protein [Escherichia coli]QFQ84184.1 hypothetical protein GIX98_07915 [Enterobacter roggenkampii]BCL44087.1 hypothetical protein OIPHN260_35890 [Enterobacter roggenkampii]
MKTSKITIVAILLVVVVTIIAVLCVLLVRSNAALNTSESDNRVLRSDNALQATVITTQAFNFNRFNQVAENASRLNSLIDASSDKTVIEYREILRREKTCDLPVPADVAGGLLSYANSLRASAMHTNSGNADAAGDSAAATSALTYCQAVLWVKPLLAAIEKANNQLAGIRQIEQDRQ